MDFDSANPHDALFRAAFADPERAADLLRGLLPPEASATIDWQTMQRLPESFVDESLRDRQADLVFSVSIAGRGSLVYVLFEHKSAPDPWVSLQLLRYVVRLWEAWRRENPAEATLPPVLPQVLYHGKRPWHGPRTLGQLLDADSLPRWLSELQPELSFHLEDLTTRSERQLRRLRVSVGTLLTLLHLQHLRRAPAGVPLLIRWRRLYRLMSASQSPGTRQLLVQLVSYVFYVAPDDPEPVAAALRSIEPIIREIDMTVADKLMARGFERGVAQGKAEGRAEGQVEGLRNALTLLLESRCGALDAAHRAKLMAADAVALDRMLRKACANATLDMVFADEAESAQ